MTCIFPPTQIVILSPLPPLQLCACDCVCKMEGAFGGFEPYKLTNVRVKAEELGRGSYAVVLLLEYRGLRCAGKKMHRFLYGNGVGDTLRRFANECRLLSETRHPNMVQFLGVYFEEGSQVPILVMEFLPMNVADCVNQYGIPPPELSYSILRDVAMGLNYLHCHSPVIIHRDLSANNVMLTSSMTAKISDLGVAKILNLTPLQMTQLTRVPGTPSYMPPEALVANPKYDTTIDVYSYGILIIHILSGKWPIPHSEAVQVDPQNPGLLIPVSEAERRDEYLQQIGREHPLMGLILSCISNNQGLRPCASEIAQRMQDMVEQFSPAFANQLEMHRQLLADAEEKKSLRAEAEQLAAEAVQKQVELEHLKEQLEANRKRTELTLSIKAEHQRLQLTDLSVRNTAYEKQIKTQNEAIIRERKAKDAFIAELSSQNEASQADATALRKENEIMQAKSADLSHQNERMSMEIADVKNQNQNMRSEIRELRSQNESMVVEIADLKSENLRLDSASKLTIQSMRAEISAKSSILTQKECELASTNTMLECSTTTIQGLNEQLGRAREYLSTNVQVLKSYIQ